MNETGLGNHTLDHGMERLRDGSTNVCGVRSNLLYPQGVFMYIYEERSIMTDILIYFLSCLTDL